MLRKVCILTLISILSFVGLATAQKTIQWSDAYKYYGQTVTVEGIVVNAYNSGKACFLNFHPDHWKHFTAVIFRSDFSKFPDNPEDFYYDKKVRITGLIEEHQGKPEIILKDPSQIVVVGGAIASKTESKVISWQDADKHYGEVATVEGTIVNTYNSGKACFLNFHTNWKRYFTVAIFRSDLPKFPNNPEMFYKDKKVRVTGLIKEYQGKPEVVLKNPSQIKVIE
jgi:DNA/RNA endonuclease YhcR with UshA esterase domain